jgi:hypothetical protein
VIQQSLDTGERFFLLGSRVQAAGSRHSSADGANLATLPLS